MSTGETVADNKPVLCDVDRIGLDLVMLLSCYLVILLSCYLVILLSCYLVILLSCYVA